MSSRVGHSPKLDSMLLRAGRMMGVVTTMLSSLVLEWVHSFFELGSKGWNGHEIRCSL